MNRSISAIIFASLAAIGFANEKVYVPHARALALTGSPKVSIKDSFDGLKTIDLCLPGPSDILESRLSCYFTGKDLSEEDLNQIKTIIAKFYADYNRPFVRISFPKQSTKNGVLQVLVQEAVVGQIDVVGNKHFSISPICKYLRTQPSEPINTKTMLADINFINRNPFRRVDVVYSAGSEPGTTDITLNVRDRTTLRFYAGYDNTGVEPLGMGRFFSGFNWANAFNLDHIFSFQYSMNPAHPKEFQSVSAHYTAPLPWRNTLLVYGGYSWITGPNGTGAQSNGKTAQSSFRYQFPLPSTGGLLHELEWGADWKWTNNEILFNAGNGRIQRYANLFQFQLGYNLDYQTQITNTTFDIELLAGPGKWLPHESENDYFLLRAGAKPKYIYGRSTVSEFILLPRDFAIWAFLRGQASSSNLLPSEQTGLGGYDTVRGYEERTFNVDNALLFNLEIRSPTIAFTKRYGEYLKNELTFLAFFDYGFGANHEGDVIVETGNKPTVWLAGAGPGVRWNFGRYVSVRYDWGVRINQKKSEVGTGWQQSHFAFTASY